MIQKLDFISIGVIAKAHGIRGEVCVKPLTDELQQFDELESVYLTQNNRRSLIKVIKVRVNRNLFVLKFKDINDRTSAEQLKGSILERKITELRRLDEDEYYIFNLIGLEVKDLEGNKIGKISDVLTQPANDVYVVDNNEREYLVPAIKKIIVKVDLLRKEMLINPIEGLFD